MDNTFKNLKGLIGEEFDSDDVICCFQDTDKEVIIKQFINDCTRYNAYLNDETSIVYLIRVNDDRIITNVYEV